MHFTLRPWSHNDIDSLIKFGNNKNIAKNMTDKFPHPYSKENASEFIEFALQSKSSHMLAIDSVGEAIGGIGIHLQTDIHRKNAELGYWLGEPFWGKGIIASAITQMIEYAFTNLDITRIFARPFGTNYASQKVLEKAGFKLEARFENTLIKDGTYIDELVYAIRKK